MPPQAREALVTLIELDAMYIPCFANITRPKMALLQCPQITIQLSYDPDVVVRSEEFDFVMEGEPPQRMRFTERARTWTFTIEGIGCPDGQASEVSFTYRSITERSTKPVKDEAE